MPARRRADTLLAERGLAASRTAAAACVRAGRVRLGDHGPAVAKPSQLLPGDAELVIDSGADYVSRGGVKLANALDSLEGIAVGDRDCLDVGASTGGFSDCLLQRGAARVIALDVGYGQLAWELRRDDRVAVLERTNARDLDGAELPFEPTLVTIDASFISLAKLLGPVSRAGGAGVEVLAMVKPQFELGPDRVGRGGVVRAPADRRDALRAVAAAGEREGLIVRGLAPSGLAGPKGNRETFIWFARGDEVSDGEALRAEALEAEIERVDA